MLKAIRRGYLGSSLESPLFSSRMSILPNGNFSLPALRWWDGGKTPTHHKSPLLSLKLSSHSFLNSSIEDDTSEAVVYTVKTTDILTTVLRCDDDREILNIAMIKWPGGVTKEAKEANNSLLVKMRGHHWSNGQAFLRTRSHSDSRKFAIPGYSHSMTWKRYGTSYWCTTSGIKGPIATLDLPKGLEPIRLTVYETLHDKHDPQALSAYKGVSLLLLDYLIVTALLCVTDITAWMLLKKVSDVTDIPFHQDTDSVDEELRYVPDFHDPYALRRTPSDISLTSLATTVSRSVTTFPRSLEPYGTRMPTYLGADASSSMGYSESFASKVEDWSKDCWPPLPSIQPSSSVESLQYPPSPMSVETPTHSSRHMPPVSTKPPQFANYQPGSSTPSHREHPRLHDQPHAAAIHRALSLQMSCLGLENRHSLLFSKQPPNISNSTHRRSESQSRPLPKPPTESEIWRTQSLLSDESSRESQMRMLPATPVIASYSSHERTVAEGSGHLQVHAQALRMTKASQDDLTQWFDALTDSERVQPTPLSESVVFSMPPPSYASIYFSQPPVTNCIPTSST